MLLTFTIELISLAASNSAFIFCFCNLIIAVLLWSGSRSQPKFPQRSPHAVNRRTDHENKAHGRRKENQVTDTIQQPVLPHAVNRRIDHENKAHGRRMENQATDTIRQRLPARSEENDRNELSDGDDELKRRAEEFIEKIIRSWKEEKLGNSPKP